MPNPVKTDPSVNWYRRIFGGPSASPMNSEFEKQNPDMAREWANMERRMPDTTAKVKQLRYMTPNEVSTDPNAYAFAFPDKSIAVNMNNINKSKYNQGELLTHELTHIKNEPSIMGAVRDRIFGSPEDNIDYYLKPSEVRAYAAQNRMPAKRNDIYLPIETGPSKMRRK